MAKTITIIGAGGKMGKWFSSYFLNNGFEVTGHDLEKPVLKSIINSDSLIGSITSRLCFTFYSYQKDT